MGITRTTRRRTRDAAKQMEDAQRANGESRVVSCYRVDRDVILDRIREKEDRLQAWLWEKTEDTCPQCRRHGKVRRRHESTVRFCFRCGERWHVT